MQDVLQWHKNEILKRLEENQAPQDAFEMLQNLETPNQLSEIMNIQQLQNDKLHIINWITELQDYSIVEKIKSLMTASSTPYVLTDEQQEILNSHVNEDKSHYIDADKLYNDLKDKYEL